MARVEWFSNANCVKDGRSTSDPLVVPSERKRRIRHVPNRVPNSANLTLRTHAQPNERTLPAYFVNVIVGGGLAPVRAYVEELLPDVMEGRIEPGRVFDRVAGLDQVPDGYRAMNDRETIKVTVQP